MTSEWINLNFIPHCRHDKNEWYFDLINRQSSGMIKKHFSVISRVTAVDYTVKEI